MTEEEKIINLQKRAKETVFVFMFGLRTSGKSAMLAAMFHAMNINSHLGTVLPLGTYSSDPSKRSINLFDAYLDAFAEKGAFPDRNTGEHVHEISLRYTPFKKRNPPINLTFLEVAGEALEDIKVINKGNLPTDINVYFKIPNIRIIFLLVGEYINHYGFGAHETREDTEAELQRLNPDSYISTFLNHIHNNGVNINIADFLLVVTKWDKHERGGANETFTKHINTYYKATLNRITRTLKKDTNKAIPFSVGHIGKTTAGKDFLVDFNPKPAYKVWEWVYERAINKKKTWWEKLLEFFSSI